jgi:hypothetical protein
MNTTFVILWHTRLIIIIFVFQIVFFIAITWRQSQEQYQLSGEQENWPVLSGLFHNWFSRQSQQ